MDEEHRELKSTSSYEISSPTASQRGGGLVGFTVKKYYCADVPGEAEAAMQAAMDDYQKLLDFRPIQGSEKPA